MRTITLSLVSLATFAFAAACGPSNNEGSPTVGGVHHADTGVGGDETSSDDAYDDSLLPPAVDVFGDQPGYVTHTGSTNSRKLQHLFHVPSLGDYTKSDCGTSGCHDGAGSGEQIPLLAGGTVYWMDNGAPAAGVEVRLVDATGAGTSVYSDVDGVFYFRLPTGASRDALYPAHTGARAGGDSELMSTEVKQIGCNAANCHDGTEAYPVILVPRPGP